MPALLRAGAVLLAALLCLGSCERDAGDLCDLPTDGADYGCGACLNDTSCAWCDSADFDPASQCGTYGRLADAGCPLSSIVTVATSERLCRRGFGSPPCEGRGECVCGVCQCAQRPDANESISGRYCECDNFNCPRYNRVLCAGHGACECGQCDCEPGYSGRACECAPRAACVADNGKVCSGHGECVCGRCRCDERYSGATCGTCPTCPKWCMEYKPCVRCQAYRTGALTPAECAQCPFNVELVEGLPEQSNTVTTNCRFIDPADECEFEFVYFGDVAPGSDSLVLVKADKVCPTPAP